MKTPSKIYTRLIDSTLWIRPDGRGTFQESSIIKSVTEAAFEKGTRDFVVDLEMCLAMDSTFMGMLAGIGMRVRKAGRGSLKVIGTSDKTKASLIELGLVHLMEIEPEVTPWDNARLEEIRAELQTPCESTEAEKKEDHVRECHEILCDADQANFDRFKTVLDVMGSTKTRPRGN